MIIDGLTHVTKNGRWFNTSHDASLHTLLKNMDKSEISKSVITSFYDFIPNKFIYECQTKHSDRIIGFGSLSIKNLNDDIKEIKNLGLKGIKLHPRIQNISFIDLINSDFLYKVEDLGIPLLICCWPQSSKIKINDFTPKNIDLISKKHSNLNIIIGHMSGHNFWDAIFCARSNKNVYLDCSYFINFFKGTSLENDFWKIINKIDQKLIYGSDFPEINNIDNINYFKSKLNKSAKNTDKSRILYKNINSLINE